MKNAGIAIVGAGISGLSVALALSQRGFANIELFERANSPGEVGAGIQLGPNAVRSLHKLGLGEPLAKSSDSSAWGAMREGETNRLLARLPLSEYSQKVYGVPSYQILRSDLHALLLAQVSRLGIALHTGRGVVGSDHHNGKAELNFSDGNAIRAGLVIGADGVNSTLASQMYPDYPVYFSGFACWRATIDQQAVVEAPGNSVSVWTGSGKHLIAYPVAGSTRLNLVGVTARENWNFPAQIQPSGAGEWQKEYADWAPEVLALIRRAGDVQLRGLFERPRLPAWGRDNCILIGDAAHPMLPSLAQGAAQGIEDALLLAELLSRTQGEGFAEIGHKFYRLRRGRVERVQESARWNIRYFHRPGSVFRTCRNLAMRAAGPIATRLIARRYHWLYREE